MTRPQSLFWDPAVAMQAFRDPAAEKQTTLAWTIATATHAYAGLDSMCWRSQRVNVAQRLGLQQNAKVDSDINATPMVDVMLVLLIILMVMTPMVQKGFSGSWRK